MTKELIETLRLIEERIKQSGHACVFIPIEDFSWHNEKNGQLTKLYNEGYIVKPRFFDNGAELCLTAEGREFLNKNHDESDNTRQTVFISYNWGSDEIANELQRKLAPYAEVKRDKTSVKPWGDLDNFMRSIRKQDFAVLIISDAYLRSDACLYEVLQLMKDENWDKRAMYIVMDDTHIYKSIDRIDYLKYWQEKCAELEIRLKS